jgi:hypothetical protein
MIRVPFKVMGAGGTRGSSTKTSQSAPTFGQHKLVCPCARGE